MISLKKSYTLVSVESLLYFEGLPMDDLPLLKDIHLPDPIGAFIFGYGCWLFVAILCLILALRFVYTKTRRYKTLKLFNQIQKNQIGDVAKISLMLKRACLIKHKKQAVLFGKPWIDFLKEKTQQQLKPNLAEILISAPYMPQDKNIKKQDFEQIKKFAQNFLEKIL